MRIKQFTTHLILIVSVIAFSACGSSDSGTENPGTPPDVPELGQYQPDTDYFKQNPSKTAQIITGYYSAATYVNSVVDPLFMTPNSYLPYFTENSNADAEFNDGSWEWNYEYGAQSFSWQIRRTVTETTDSYSWHLFLSFDGGMEGMNYDNYEFMVITISKDGKSGNWRMNSFENDTSTPMFTMEWDYSDENNQLATYVFNTSGVDEFKVSYSNDNDDYSILIETVESDDTLIQWNESTNEGSISEGTNSTCWDGTFHDVSCG